MLLPFAIVAIASYVIKCTSSGPANKAISPMDRLDHQMAVERESSPRPGDAVSAFIKLEKIILLVLLLSSYPVHNALQYMYFCCIVEANIHLTLVN